MTNEKIYRLITRLYENTEGGRTNWEVTARSNSFASYLSDYSVLISEENGDYYLTIMNQEGDLIERISDVELGQEHGNSLKLMQTLFAVSRRNARGADKAIDDILSSLD
jgi:hypothetical protein